MKKFKTKKGVALLAVLVVALAAAIGAYAYITGTGSGTGSASVGSVTGTWSMSDLASGPLYVGANAAVTGTLNNTGTTAEGLNTVTVTIGTASAGCTTDQTNGDFTLSAAPSTWVVAAGGQSATYTEATPPNVAIAGSTALPAGLSLNYANETNRAQNSCETGSVGLGWSVT